MTIFDHLLDILRMPNSVAGESRGKISVQKMKELVMDRYEWEYSGQLAEAPQAQVDSQDDLDL